MHVHFTLLDIHTGVLARDLCIMMLLDDLVEGRCYVAQVEIRLTIFYTSLLSCHAVLLLY